MQPAAFGGAPTTIESAVSARGSTVPIRAANRKRVVHACMYTSTFRSHSGAAAAGARTGRERCSTLSPTALVSRGGARTSLNGILRDEQRDAAPLVHVYAAL